MSFADNSSTNSTELFDQLVVYSGGTFKVIVPSLICLSVFLFPFYAYLNTVNRPQDSQRPVFPILNFFFEIMRFSAVGYTFTTLYFAVVFIRGKTTDPSYDFLGTPLFRYGLFIAFFNFLATTINMPVCQLLTSILAFHRFLLYFFPRIGDFLTPGKKAAKILIFLLYVVFLAGFVIFFFINRKIKVWNKVQIFHLYYVGIGLSEMLISTPYTFMILSIRRLTHLASAIQSRPEKYIAYQIIIAFVIKSFSFLSVFTIWCSNSCLKEKQSGCSLRMFMGIDMLTFPLSVQLAYILSNKKNVDMLIAVITGKVMFWKNRARVEVESSTRF